MESNIKINLLRTMILIREFENFVGAAKFRNEIMGQVHCCIGQEAVVVGTCAALEKSDYVISNHRSHGHVLAKGANLNAVMAEMYGKATGTNGGKGGSMHIFDKEVGSICTTAIVGSGLPIGCGAAFASKFKKDGKVTVVFFGDGATNEGTFGECMNLASSLKLPIIFLLENNGIAITTHFHKVTIQTEIYERAKAFGIKSIQINGQDVEEVYNTVKVAIESIKNGDGPMFIEVKTTRFSEHFEGAHFAKIAKLGYRDNAKIEELKISSDPILNFFNKLLYLRLLSSDDFQQIVKEEKIKVQKAFQFALDSPEPDIDMAYTNIFV
jgi:TPP-dependent pyruvate/acetoin dehydrogenase alpha subunit